MATQWGRKESVVWPPHSPIYTYGAILMALVCTGAFLWAAFAAQTPLQQFYTPAYVKSAVVGQLKKQDKYRLLYLWNGSKAARIATSADVAEGATATPDGKNLPVAMSPAAAAKGFHALYRGPEAIYQNTPLHSYLKSAVFEGQEFGDIYGNQLWYGLLAFLAMLPFSIFRDVKRRKELKYGRRLKGPQMCSAKEFNKAVEGDGMGIQTADDKVILRIPKRTEAQHIEIIGDTGSGKTTLLMQYLRQIADRGETAIVHDPACEFVQRFYNEKRGDIILNPLDDRCPYWGPAEELRSRAEAKAVAASLYQPTSDKKGEFFTETPQKIFAHLLTKGPSPQDLVRWMSDPAEIDRRVEGTEYAQMIAKGAQEQRSGVLASLGLIADSLRMLPIKEQAKRSWSATEWAETRQGWIFITSKATEREALRPLHSLWIDLLVLRLMSAPTEKQKKVWFVLDELASLQRLPQFHTAITENRKSGNPIILGLQGKAQLEVVYSPLLAQVMLSQPATKIFLKTTEPNAAEWVSNAIGKIEIERVKETHSDGTRSGKSFTLDRQIEPLVMDSEISGLDDKHAFLKLGNNVARFNFNYLDIPKTIPAFMPRRVENDELEFDPKTLKSKRSTPNEIAVEAIAEPKIATPLVRDKESVTPVSEKKKPRAKRARKVATPQTEDQGQNEDATMGGQEQPDAVEPPDLDPDTPPWSDDDAHAVHAFSPDGY